MKKRYFIAILVILSCFLIPSVLAEQEEIPVSVYLLGISNYDAATGSYDLDFFIQFDCETECTADDFWAINGKHADVIERKDEYNKTYYRVRGTMIDKVELQDFPLDTQTIKLVVEHARFPLEKVKLVPNLAKSGIDNRIFFPGWKIAGWTAYNTEHFYTTYDQFFSTYVFEVRLTRHLDAAISFFLPIFFIIFIILFTFLLGINKLELRLGIVSSALIAAIMYQLAISAKLPPAVGYLLLADKVMLLTYFILLVSFILNIYMLKLVQVKKVKTAQKWFNLTKYNMIIISISLYILLFVLFYFKLM
ncbi:hypothetical protein KY333_01980 [Candidatus Woesearchaeota archaeon]|nr:hypothetical protein [Candidatus Woesearchaeota archaeon]